MVGSIVDCKTVVETVVAGVAGTVAFGSFVRMLEEFVRYFVQYFGGFVFVGHFVVGSTVGCKTSVVVRGCSPRSSEVEKG